MAINPFQHIDLRVNDLDRAWDFYAAILPAIGFTEGHRGQLYSGFEAPGTPPAKPWFGFTVDPEHRPNQTRIAFWAESRAKLDAIAALLPAAGALHISGPKECPEYTKTYYAVFFEDPFGNRLEICHRDD